MAFIVNSVSHRIIMLLHIREEIFFFFERAINSIILMSFYGIYTRMLQAVLDKSWMQHPTKQQLYVHLTPITKVRRTRHTGHCWRNKDELISDVLLWTPSHGRAKVEGPVRTYIQKLCVNTGCRLEELSGAMDDRDGWPERGTSESAT